MKILVVDDDVNIREVIKEYLRVNNYEVYQATNGIEALQILEDNKNKINLVILDVMMPKMDGITCLSKIRSVSNIPVIILSAKTQEEDKLIGFENGTDDYIVKPFSPKELVARVKAILNRDKLKHDIYEFNKLKIDKTSKVVTINDKEIKLSPKEYDLLLYLVINKNIALSREDLLLNVWGYDFYDDDRTVDTHIKTLRASIGEYRNYIVTLRGMGYKFEYKNQFN